MSSVNDGGPAFPQPMIASQKGDGTYTNPSDGWGLGGMSLRDWFAAKALAGLLADSTFNVPPEQAVQIAFRYADAMLTQRGAPDPRIEAALGLLTAIKEGLGFIQRHHDEYEGWAPDHMKEAIERAEAAGLKV